MRGRDLIASVALLSAWATGVDAIGEVGGVDVLQDGAPQATCERFELPSSAWGVPTVLGSHCTLIPLGGGGGGAQPLLTFASCMGLDGTSQTYLGAGGCADPNEPLVQGRVKTAVSLAHLSCALSGAAGGSAVVTATLRTGACGGLTDTGVTCLIGTGQTACDAGATTAAVSAGQCFAVRISSSATFSTVRAVTCTARVTA